MKSALERMLDTERNVQLGRPSLPALAGDNAQTPDPSAPKNRRNGHSQKTVRGELGELTLDTPRDRHGTFEPQVIPKQQRRLTGFDEKILALYARAVYGTFCSSYNHDSRFNRTCRPHGRPYEG
jgi:putative transposase